MLKYTIAHSTFIGVTLAGGTGIRADWFNKNPAYAYDDFIFISWFLENHTSFFTAFFFSVLNKFLTYQRI